MTCKVSDLGIAPPLLNDGKDYGPANEQLALRWTPDPHPDGISQGEVVAVATVCTQPRVLIVGSGGYIRTLVSRQLVLDQNVWLLVAGDPLQDVGRPVLNRGEGIALALSQGAQNLLVTRAEIEKERFFIEQSANGIGASRRAHRVEGRRHGSGFF